MFHIIAFSYKHYTITIVTLFGFFIGKSVNWVSEPNRAQSSLLNYRELLEYEILHKTSLLLCMYVPDSENKYNDQTKRATCIKRLIWPPFEAKK